MDEDQSNKQHDFKFNPQENVISKTSGSDLNVNNTNETLLQGNNTIDQNDDLLFNWSAPDSFSIRKSILWYLILIIGTVVIASAIFLITKDKITTGVILLSGFLIGVYATKKPKMVDYQLTKYGFAINGRRYKFGSYKSFSVIQHGDFRSAVLIPLKRFLPRMYINFDSSTEQKITAVLSGILPKETSRNDPIDKILIKIGF
jgi:hypothetical protein